MNVCYRTCLPSGLDAKEVEYLWFEDDCEGMSSTDALISAGFEFKSGTFSSLLGFCLPAGASFKECFA